jgi:hypothetical protein
MLKFLNASVYLSSCNIAPLENFVNCFEADESKLSELSYDVSEQRKIDAG